MPKVIHEADVFAAVSKVFTRLGYEAATTRLLAEAAGMHEATLFRKYGSKERLYVEAMEHEFSRVPLAHVAHTGDLDADLLGIVDAYIDTLRSHGDIMMVLLVEVQRHPELRPATAAPARNLEAIGDVVERYQAQGRLVREDPADAIAALLGPLMVGHLRRRADPAAARPLPSARAHVERFLRGRGAGDRGDRGSGSSVATRDRT